eukprot:598591-Rhodomonas_salina.1
MSLRAGRYWHRPSRYPTPSLSPFSAFRCAYAYLTTRDVPNVAYGAPQTAQTRELSGGMGADGHLRCDAPHHLLEPLHHRQ